MRNHNQDWAQMALSIPSTKAFRSLPTVLKYILKYIRTFLESFCAMHWNQTRRWETPHLKNDSFSLSGRCLATLAADILRSLSANQREHPTEFKFPNNINSKDHRHVNLSNSDRYLLMPIYIIYGNISTRLWAVNQLEREMPARPDLPFPHSTLPLL